MEQKNDNKWIEDAFKEAQPKIDGKTVDEFAEHMDKAFFAGGYKVRMDEEKKGGEK